MNWLELSVTINGQVTAVREEFDVSYKSIHEQSKSLTSRLIRLLVDREIAGSYQEWDTDTNSCIPPEAEG